MIWWQWVFITISASYLFYVGRSMWRDHDTWVKREDDRHLRAMFRVANEERETLEKMIHTAPFPVSPCRRDESPWDYTRRIADMGYFKLKPWEPAWSGMQTTTDITIKNMVWTTVDGNVTHRVGYVRLTNGTQMSVRFCAPTLESSTPVEEHLKEQCPLITCIMCITKVKD